MQNRLSYSRNWTDSDLEMDEVDAGYWTEPSFERDGNLELPRSDFHVYVGITAFLFILFILARLNPLTTGQPPARQGTDSTSSRVGFPGRQITTSGALSFRAAPNQDNTDPYEFTAPYEQYVLTQGLHGFSYGHAAIDLAGGKGTVIMSPINGQVSAHYVDQYGNPTLIIENEAFRVTLLHGIYEVEEGDILEAGDPVGFESNLGYTTDMNGNRCGNGRDCGYHTHLNVFDKINEANTNPLDLLSP